MATVNIDFSTSTGFIINRPEMTFEGALYALLNNYILSPMSPHTKFKIKYDIDVLNSQFNKNLGVDINEDGIIIIYSEEDLIFPVPLTRKVLVEKKNHER